MTSTQTSELDKYLNPEDYVFGSSNKYYNATENKMVISKPRYVRYTLESLKKRSTKRLETMHFNLYGKISDRYTMISNLYNKLNQMWNMYNTETSTVKIDKFGFRYWQGSEPAKKSVGRPAVFETEQQVTKLYVEYLGGATLNQISKKYQVNICTLSQTFSGKGKYASWLFGDESEMEYYQ